MYNMKVLYGLTAIDIDQPQKDYAVSVELEIVIGEGQDTTQKASVDAGLPVLPDKPALTG
jgi:hypothetical protein